MALSKQTWAKREKRQPLSFAVKSLGGELVIVRPMSAARRSQIDAKFPTDPETDKLIDSLGYSAAIIADSIIDDVGEPVFTIEDLIAMDDAVFRELGSIVSNYLGLGGAAKN